MSERAGYVYIMASQPNGTIYIGVTSHLTARVWQHREGLIAGFTRKYGCKHLVWFMAFDDIESAHCQELRIKKWNRAWKLRLIEKDNPQWCDLYPGLV